MHLQAARETLAKERRIAGLPEPPKVAPGLGHVFTKASLDAASQRGASRARHAVGSARRVTPCAAAGAVMEQSRGNAAAGRATSAPVRRNAPGASTYSRSGHGAHTHAGMAGGPGASQPATSSSAQPAGIAGYAPSAGGPVQRNEVLWKREPTITVKPYHTEARLFFNLSLLPTNVTALQRDSGKLVCAAVNLRQALHANAALVSIDQAYWPSLLAKRSGSVPLLYLCSGSVLASTWLPKVQAVHMQ